ncbi:hypothetical protein GCM10027586_17110 [Kineococcus gypseus]|uniref:hypothetical protein n=1 Tax=Kineococcus gypseus TaxID=1637102 RepID=UPI003D7C8FF8
MNQHAGQPDSGVPLSADHGIGRAHGPERVYGLERVHGAGASSIHRECAQQLAAVQEQLDHLQAVLARVGVLPPAGRSVCTEQAGGDVPSAARAAGPVRTSRRGLLGAGAAALGGLAAGQMLTPVAASAATGGPVVLGRANTADATTSIAGPAGKAALTLLGGANENGFNRQALDAQGNVSIQQSAPGTGLLIEGGSWESSSSYEYTSGAVPGTTVIINGAHSASGGFTHEADFSSEGGAVGLEVTAKANIAISAYASNGVSTRLDDSGRSSEALPGTALHVKTDPGGTGILVESGGVSVTKGKTVVNDGLEVRAGGATVTGSTAQDSITGTAAGSGRAVYGLASNATNSNGAITGEHRGKGAAVWGHQASASAAAEAAVVGYSVNGRGARFRGALAQVQLTPAAAAAPPAGGAAGDVFVDKTHRLWFCRSTSTTAVEWQQVQIGPARRAVRVGAAVTAAVGDVVLADATAMALTITLPAVVPGAQVSVKKIDASARVVTVRAAGTAVIDGLASRTLNARWQSLSLISDGKDWFVA